jgi:hypothetical protein
MNNAAQYSTSSSSNMMKMMNIAPQLILDVYTLKNKFIQSGIAIEKTVNMAFSKLEKILKLLTVQNDQIVELFKQFFPNDNSTELLKIMNLKGIAKNEQTILMKNWSVERKTS